MNQQLPTIFDDLNEFYNFFRGCSTPKSCQRSSNEGLCISEDEENLYIDASLPGVKSDEVRVTINPKNRHLCICGEGKLDRTNAKYLVKGVQNHCYEIPLSNDINLDSKIDAVSRDGVLSITLPKNKSHKPLKIDVRVE